MTNGTSRLVLAEVKRKNMSQAEINAAFKNESDVAKSAKKFESRSAIEHNHSSNTPRAKK